MQDLQEKARREVAFRVLASKKLFYQMKYIFEYHYAMPLLTVWHHEFIAEHLEALYNGDIRFLIINMPPSYGKTELCVRQFVPFCLGQDAKTKIIYTSYSDELSKKVSGEARDIIKGRVFSNLHSIKLNPTQDQKHHWQTKENGLLFATSTGGTVTGVHANIIIVDDPLKVSECVFKSARDEGWRFFSESLTSRLLKDGKRLIIMQRLHVDDIVGRVIKELPTNAYTHINLKVIESRPITYIINDFSYERKPGEVLCEEWQSKEDVETFRLMMGEVGFKTQYLQDPEISEAGFFEKGIETYISEMDIKKQNMYIFIDPAMGLKDNSDDRAIIVCGWSKDEQELETCVVYECLAGVWSLESFIERILNTMLRHKDASVYMESDGGGLLVYQALIPEFIRFNTRLVEQKREPLNHLIQTFPSPRRISKNQRIIGMHAYYITGQLKFKKDGPGIDLLLAELWSFLPDNLNNKDNRIDALAHAFNQRGKLVFPFKEAIEYPTKTISRFKKGTWNV